MYKVAERVLHEGSELEETEVGKANQLQFLEKKVETLAHALIARSRRDEHLTVTETDGHAPLDTYLTQETGIDLGTHYQDAGPRITLGCTETNSLYTVDDSTSSIANLSPHKTQSLLDGYAVLMAPHMPFVLLPELPATSSFATSPLLLQAIIAISHFHDTSIQQVLVKDLVHQITSKIFMTAERSLDLLQALLVLCTWYNPHLFQTTSHTSLLHLCMALATDLAIDRDPSSCEMAHLAAAMRSCGIPQPVEIVSNEERRAVLGVFWVSSTVFTSFRKTDVPTWTPWLQTCLSVLAQTELESDRALVSLVQSQRIMHQAMSPPSLLHDPNTLQIELDNIVPPDTHTAERTSATLLRLQRACSLVAVWEPSFSTHNLNGIWSCITALTSYLTLYAALPVPSYPTVPFTVFAQFAYVFVVMVRASSTHFDGFDGTLLRELVDFEKVMEEASEKYEAVGRLEVDGVRVRNEGFESWARKCRWARMWWGMKAKENAGRMGGVGDGGVEAGVLTTPDESFIDDGDWADASRLGGIDLDSSLLDSALI